MLIWSSPLTSHLSMKSSSKLSLGKQNIPICNIARTRLSFTPSRQVRHITPRVMRVDKLAASSRPRSVVFVTSPQRPLYTTEPNSLKQNSWVDRTNDKIKPYLQLIRIDKPIGTWLLLWPCWWSLAMANAPPHLYAIFGLGALVMRGAGCTINDMWDRDFDQRVERTRERPLAAGKLSLRQAVVFLAAQLSVGLAILLTLNWYSVAVGAASLLLVVTYPLMKRITYWPQLVLGLTFNWGALLGWTAVKGSLGAAPLALYVAGVAWTLIYDTIYAHMDKKDDIVIGVRSTALLFGKHTKLFLSAFSAVMVAGLTAVGLLLNFGIPYFASVLGAAGHLAWQISTVNLENRLDCMEKFISNKWLGAIVFAGIIGNGLLG